MARLGVGRRVDETRLRFCEELDQSTGTVLAVGIRPTATTGRSSISHCDEIFWEHQPEGRFVLVVSPPYTRRMEHGDEPGHRATTCECDPREDKGIEKARVRLQVRQSIQR